MLWELSGSPSGCAQNTAVQDSSVPVSKVSLIKIQFSFFCLNLTRRESTKCAPQTATTTSPSRAQASCPQPYPTALQGLRLRLGLAESPKAGHGESGRSRDTAGALSGFSRGTAGAAAGAWASSTGTPEWNNRGRQPPWGTLEFRSRF